MDELYHYYNVLKTQFRAEKELCSSAEDMLGLYKEISDRGSDSCRRRRTTLQRERDDVRAAMTFAQAAVANGSPGSQDLLRRAKRALSNYQEDMEDWIEMREKNEQQKRRTKRAQEKYDAAKKALNQVVERVSVVQDWIDENTPDDLKRKAWHLNHENWVNVQKKSRKRVSDSEMKE